MKHNKLSSLALMLAVSMLCATTTVYAQDEADSSDATPPATISETTDTSSSSDNSAANASQPEESSTAVETQTETTEQTASSSDADTNDTANDEPVANDDTDATDASNDVAEESSEESVGETDEESAGDTTDEVAVGENEDTLGETDEESAGDATDEVAVGEDEDTHTLGETDEESAGDATDEVAVGEDEDTLGETDEESAGDATDEVAVGEDEDTLGETDEESAGDATDEVAVGEDEDTLGETDEETDAVDEETIAEEEVIPEDGEPVWATQWSGGFFNAEGESNGSIDSICGFYQNSRVENWAEPQWITVHGWAQLASDDENYTGSLKANLLAGWYVSYPETATCPTEAPCTGSSNAVADDTASQVVVSDENGYVEFTVTGWWPGVDESFTTVVNSDVESEFDQFAQYVETHFGAKMYGESGEALSRFDRGDAESAEMSKDVFWYPAELSEACPYTPPVPPTCLIYAVHDHGLNDSYLFTLDPNNDFAVNELNFHENYDLEGLAIDPKANKLLISAGNDAQSHPNGQLYQVDKETGELSNIGNICFTDKEEQQHCNMEVSSLAFHPDGSLWGWAEGEGLLFIDSNTAEAKLVIASDATVEDLAWNNSGKIVYAIAQDTLWAYDGYALTQQCAIDSPAESMERLPDNVRAAYGLPEDHDVFMFAYHKESDLTMHALDAQTCEILDAFRIPTTKYYDIEGISWVCNAGLDNPPPVFNNNESVTTEDGQIIDALKPISGDVINVLDDAWDKIYNKQATAWIGGDSNDALAIRFKNIDLPSIYYIDSAYLLITNNLAAETSMVKIKVQAEKSKMPTSFDKTDLPTERELTESFHRYQLYTNWDIGNQLKIEVTGPLRELANENILRDTVALVLTGQGASEDRKYFNIEDVKLVLNLRYTFSQEATTVVVESSPDEKPATEKPAVEEPVTETPDEETETPVTDNGESGEVEGSEEGAVSGEETETPNTDEGETTTTEPEETASETDDSSSNEEEVSESEESPVTEETASETGDSGSNVGEVSESEASPVTEKPVETPSETGEESGENDFIPPAEFPNRDEQSEIGAY